MPLSQVVESPIVASGAVVEVVKRLAMDCRNTPEGVMRSRKSIERQVDDPEFSRRQLLGEEHASDLAPSGPPQRLPNGRLDIRCQFDPHWRSVE